MALTPIEIAFLQYLGANGVDKIPIENAAGVTGFATITDILNLAQAPDLSGYMQIAVYDVNDDGIVDNSSLLKGEIPDFYLDRTNHQGFQDIATITNLQAFLDDCLLASESNLPGGAVIINPQGFVPPQFINNGLYDYVGTWDVGTNTPTLADNTGAIKDTYIVSVGGTRNLGSGAITFATGDIVVHNGSIYQKVTVAAVGVTSWNLLTGNVTATTANLPASANKNYTTDIQKLGLDNAATAPSAANPFITKNDLNTSTLSFQNSWNANTNTPTLANGVGTAGQSYIVSTAGTTDFGAGGIPFLVGDLAILNASLVWIKIANTGVGVSSWNALTGAVSATTNDLPDFNAKRYVTETQKLSLAAAEAAGMNATTARIALLTDIAISGATNYQNSWSAATNTPALADGVGTAGDAYITSVAGTQNLGSGAITYAVGDFVILSAGLIWQKVPNVGVGVSSVNALTGAVTLTTNVIADFVGKRYVVEAVKDALAATQVSLNPASAGNRIATIDDIPDIGSVSVTSEWFSPERFENGATVGNGTTQMLNTVTNPATGVVYTNISAGAAFPLVAGIDVTSWTLSDACFEQAFRTMEGNLTYHELQLHDNRYYVFNQKHNRPRTNTTTSQNKAFQFIINGHGSVIRNISTVNGVLIGYTPANQAECDGVVNNLIQYNLKINDIQFLGVDNAVTQDCAIDLSSTYGSIFNNCGFYNFYDGVRIYFGLQNQFDNCKFSDNYRYGTLVSSGVWSGATIQNSGSNCTSFTGCKWRCAPGSIAGLYVFGSDGVCVTGKGNVFEGSASAPAPLYHILYDGGGATTNKLFEVDNIHVEQKCGIANFSVKTNPQTMTGNFSNLFIQGVNNCAFMADTALGGTLQMWIQNIPDNSSAFLLRQNGGQSSFWNFQRSRLNNIANPYASANWEQTTILGTAGTIPLSGRLFITGDILN